MFIVNLCSTDLASMRFPNFSFFFMLLFFHIRFAYFVFFLIFFSEVDGVPPCVQNFLNSVRHSNSRPFNC